MARRGRVGRTEPTMNQLSHSMIRLLRFGPAAVRGGASLDVLQRYLVRETNYVINVRDILAVVAWSARGPEDLISVERGAAMI